ncbi:MAG: hypothetical protein MPK75_01465 [Alphaproteobacteria bacterium]|nr:hypothetical protein [Alphaproteobacteria bacterium]
MIEWKLRDDPLAALCVQIYLNDGVADLRPLKYEIWALFGSRPGAGVDIMLKRGRLHGSGVERLVMDGIKAGYLTESGPSAGGLGPRIGLTDDGMKKAAAWFDAEHVQIQFLLRLTAGACIGLTDIEAFVFSTVNHPESLDEEDRLLLEENRVAVAISLMKKDCGVTTARGMEIAGVCRDDFELMMLRNLVAPYSFEPLTRKEADAMIAANEAAQRELVERRIAGSGGGGGCCGDAGRAGDGARTENDDACKEPSGS